MAIWRNSVLDQRISCPEGVNAAVDICPIKPGSYVHVSKTYMKAETFENIEGAVFNVFPDVQ